MDLTSRNPHRVSSGRRETDRQAGRQTGRQAGRQTGKQAGRQRDRERYKFCRRELFAESWATVLPARQHVLKHSGR